jgi:hypothetical protein
MHLAEIDIAVSRQIGKSRPNRDILGQFLCIHLVEGCAAISAERSAGGAAAKTGAAMLTAVAAAISARRGIKRSWWRNFFSCPAVADRRNICPAR